MSIVITKRPYDRCMSGNPIAYELYSALAASDSDVYFEVKIRFTKASNLFFVDSISFPAYPVEGTAKIDIKDIVNSLLSYDTPEFNANEKIETAAINQTGYVYIQFREIVPDVATDPDWDDSESDYTKFVMKGGIEYFKYRGDNFWINYFEGNNPFMTWQQSGRLASLTERIYLPFLNVTELPSWDTPEVVGPQLYAAIKVYYTDGTSSSVQYWPCDPANQYKDAFIFVPCGVEQWDLRSLAPSKNIWYWQVRMEYISDSDGTKTALNDWFKFYADNRNNYNDVTLHYRNSLGGIDSIRVRGVIEKNTNYDFLQQDATVPADYFDGDKILPRTKIASSKETIIYKGDIGYLGKEEQDRLRDIHLAREVWWEIDEKWHPVVLLTGNQRLTGTDDQLFSLPLEFSLASNGDNFYTPKAIDLGDRTFATNVCTAELSAVTFDVDTSGPTATVEVNFSYTPPGLTQYTYQVVGIHTDPITANIADLPLVLTGIPKEASYDIKLRPICTGGIKGRIFTASFNTIADGGGGGFGKTLFVINETGATLDIIVDGVNPYSFATGVNGNITITPSGTLTNDAGSSRKFKFLVSLPSTLLDEETISDGADYNFPADISFYNYVKVSVP